MTSAQTYALKQLASGLGDREHPLSPLALQRSLMSVGLDTLADGYSISEIKRLAVARFLSVVMGYDYDEISDLYRNGTLEIDLAEQSSLEQVSGWLRQEITSRQSKQDLMRKYDLDLKAVTDTISACHLSTKTRLYDAKSVETFAIARQLITRLSFSYRQVSICFSKPTVLQSFLGICQQKLYSKLDLATEFQISKDTVKKTLEYSGLSSSKRIYTEAEKLRFQQARVLISRNVSYKDLKRHLAAVCPDLDIDSSEDDLCQFLRKT